MPNWCSNTVNISGPNAQIEELRDLMETEESLFDFNSVIPQPTELKNIISGNIKINDKQYSIWREIDGEDVGIEPEEEAQLIAQYGATNWYDWNLANWGTKWNNGPNDVERDMVVSGWMTYNFSTAWSPPTPVIDALAKKFPDLHFHLEYEEPGMAFWGETEWEEGEVVENVEGELGYDEETEEFIRQ